MYYQVKADIINLLCARARKALLPFTIEGYLEQRLSGLEINNLQTEELTVLHYFDLVDTTLDSRTKCFIIEKTNEDCIVGFFNYIRQFNEHIQADIDAITAQFNEINDTNSNKTDAQSEKWDAELVEFNETYRQWFGVSEFNYSYIKQLIAGDTVGYKHARELPFERD